MNLKVKYEKEVRLCCGIAMIKKDGKVEVMRCKAWDYTNRTIISAADYERKMKEEIERVKALPGD